jgi:hypothetical protein
VLVIAIAATFALLAANTLVVALLWDRLGWVTLALLTLLWGAVAAVAGRQLAIRSRREQTPFSATLAEFGRDRRAVGQHGIHPPVQPALDAGRERAMALQAPFDALAALERRFGPDHEEVEYYALVLARDVGTDAARALYARALTIRQKRLGPDAPEVVWLLDEIASRALKSGARVVSARKDEVPGGGALAAILRYAI